MKKRMITMGLTLTLLLGLTGCSRDNMIPLPTNEKTEISLSWWGKDVRHEYMLQCIDQFEEAYPNIRVNVAYCDWDSYKLRNQVNMNAGSESDVMLINCSWLSDFSKDGTGYFDITKLSEEFAINNYSKDSLEYGYSNGVLNAIPISLNAKVAMFNETIYTSHGLKVPETWEDLFEAATVLQKDNIYPLIMSSGANLTMPLIAYTEQKSGNTFISSKGGLGFTKQDLKMMLEFYQELVDRKVVNFHRSADNASLADGSCAGGVEWITNMGKFKSSIEEASGTYTIGKLFATADGKNNGWYAKPATMYAVSAHTKYPKEAGLLLDYLLNSEEAALLTQCEKGIPLSKSNFDVLQKNEMIDQVQNEASQMVQEVGVGVMHPKMEDTNVINAIGAAIDSVYYGVASSEEAADVLYTALKEAIQ